MFTKIEPLTHDNHQDLRFTTIQNFDFAKNISNAPISFSEFLHSSRYYPIVFPKDTNVPVVLLSLNQDQNNFVNTDGSWKVPYIPAHFRQYPFVLVKAAPSSESNTNTEPDNLENQDKYVVCIDRDAPHFESTQGDIMFTANGQFTDMTIKAVDFLKLFQQEMSVTSTIVKLMEEKGLLVDRQFNVNVNGQNISVGGFRTVDMQKLNELEDAVLADWVRKGIISLIISHTNSLSGMQIS
ncbi:MAG: SapC family protein [Desulfamplus sp.]|nr:SapC family protein [Desulfamplus sp.]MBF0259864.1 SapC family protein [Desulfamplus sp.]